MPIAAGMGEPLKLPEMEYYGPKIINDRVAAHRLRDRVAREIAAIIDAGGDGAQCADLTPVFRWLNVVAEETE